MRLKIPHQTQLSSSATARRHVSWLPLCRWRLDVSLYLCFLICSTCISNWLYLCLHFVLSQVHGWNHLHHLNFISACYPTCIFVFYMFRKSTHLQRKAWRYSWWYGQTRLNTEPTAFKQIQHVWQKPNRMCQDKRDANWTECSFKMQSVTSLHYLSICERFSVYAGQDCYSGSMLSTHQVSQI